MDLTQLRQLPLLFVWMAATLISLPVTAVEIDNGVIGTPTIDCGTDEIDFWVQTRNPFMGKVYVKGEYGNPDCMSMIHGNGQTTIFPPDSTTRPDTCPPCPICENTFQARTKRQANPVFSRNSPTMAHITVKLGSCNTKRDRQLEPAGVMMGLTVVVSFHQHFVTKVDKAYAVQCMYMEAQKTVTSEIDVSMPQTTEITGSAPMPRCEYTIRRESPDGPEIRFARVGDKVFHKWECTTEMPGVFGMLVHSCTVDDGQGQKVTIIDDKGCSVDKFVLSDLTYDNLLFAYVEAHVFKFADRPVLDFQCAMTICVKTDGGCDNVTPPQCERVRSRRAVLSPRNATSWRSVLTDEDETNQWRLHARRLTVMDLDDKLDEQELLDLEQRYGQNGVKQRWRAGSDGRNITSSLSRLNPFRGAARSTVCLSVAGFGILVSLATFMLTLAAVGLGGLYVLRTRRKV